MKDKYIGLDDPRFDHKEPYLWIQWKGTDVCCDITCECGESFHYDGDFLYTFQCPHCKKFWETGTHIPVYEITKEEAGEYVKLPEKDDFFDVT